MKNFFLNRQIRRIEKEANNDFLQILSFGARCYPTKELHQLLHDLDQEAQRHAYFRRILFMVGGTTTLWIALCFLFQSLNFGVGIYLTLGMIPASILAFSVGSIYVNQKFRSIREAGRIEKIIVEELERRKKDASIF
ncbi:MAG: hypothetical protein KDD10_05590 [Phaeodactylibacter sp.]|nr:hypothetical protein [Phaeodactylibacter sp.]MCB9292621.1 hypothetical protein [Lewinellaceae bacterium]